MTENRLKDLLKEDVDPQKIHDVFFAGYESGVWDTMIKHDVFTDPVMAALMCKELMELHGDKLVEAFKTGGDISRVIPTGV